MRTAPPVYAMLSVRGEQTCHSLTRDELFFSMPVPDVALITGSIFTDFHCRQVELMEHIQYKDKNYINRKVL